ncbi:MAG: NYN domain-containing protein [Candidatus Brennerbacteria bacterium]|nr:NYN domain-containing protein [Candidatus Brennerbacteria bacterium]
MNKVSIHIDGANFYLLALKPLGIQDANFDYEKFVLMLANGRDIISLGKRFYIGTVPEREGDLKSKAAVSRQTSLFTRLRGGRWEIKTSIHKKKIEKIQVDDRVVDWENLLQKGVSSFTFEKYREKGIDVKLATDLIVGAVDDQYDTALIVSSDTDLIPAIDWVRSRGKKVEYVGFSIPHPTNPRKDIKPTVAMVDRTDAPSRILIESDIKSLIIGQQSILG